MSEPRWLSAQEHELWMTMVALMETVPSALDAQLRRDHGLTRFEYIVLAMLSERDDATRPMTDLSIVTNGSLSRLSHAVSRLESRGWITRAPSPADRRTQLVTLTDLGRDKLVATAPSHVDEVRRIFFDALPASAIPELTQALRAVVQGSADGCPATPSCPSSSP